ncbi:MAG TPA: phage tail protein, partial [Verrucomicrobiae bacterium]|nr:phage tail protein [Verrucomicrobiae bacterium]
GNGAVFLPNTQPIYDLSSNDLLTPVTVKRPSIADVMNSVSVEFLNRANDYNVEIAEDKDDAMIAVYGLRKASPRQAHAITTTAVAQQVANFLRKREVEIRATYTLTLGWQFNLLEPMDLITLTVPELGYSKKPVRITAIREDDNGQLEIDAEDFPFGTASPTLYPQQSSGGFVPQANADPGNVNTPVVFEAPFLMSQSGQHEIWMRFPVQVLTGAAAMSGSARTIANITRLDRYSAPPAWALCLERPARAQICLLFQSSSIMLPGPKMVAARLTLMWQAHPTIPPQMFL